MIESIWRAIKKTFAKKSKRLPLNKQQALEQLLEAKQIFKDLNINMWITDGTLLGFYREGNFLGHDLDMDIACKIEDYRPQIKTEFINHGWQLKRELGTFDCGYEQTWVKGNIYMDIFYFYQDGNRLWHGAWQRDKKTKKRNLIKYYYNSFELEKHTFLGHRFMCPTPIESYVIQKYGPNWHTPKLNWDWAFDPVNAKATDVWQ